MNKFLGILFLILVHFTAGIDSGAATPGVGFKTLSRIGRLQIYVRSKKQKESVFDKISEAVDNFDKLKKVERLITGKNKLANLLEKEMDRVVSKGLKGVSRKLGVKEEVIQKFLKRTSNPLKTMADSVKNRVLQKLKIKSSLKQKGIRRPDISGKNGSKLKTPKSFQKISSPAKFKGNRPDQATRVKNTKSSFGRMKKPGLKRGRGNISGKNRLKIRPRQKLSTKKVIERPGNKIESKQGVRKFSTSSPVRNSKKMNKVAKETGKTRFKSQQTRARRARKGRLTKTKTSSRTNLHSKKPKSLFSRKSSKIRISKGKLKAFRKASKIGKIVKMAAKFAKAVAKKAAAAATKGAAAAAKAVLAFLG